MHKRAFYMINSLAVSTGDLFDLSVMEFEPRISGVVSIRHSTLSAAGTFFDIRGAKLTEMATEPLSLFVQETVFAPPLDPGTKPSPKPALLVCEESLRDKKQIDWWGDSNGYSPDIIHFLRTPDAKDTTVQRMQTNWLLTWKPDRIVRPLSGPDGVFLQQSKLPQRTNIDADSFSLHTSSKAYGWGPNEMPIGVDFSTWESRDRKARNTTANKPDSSDRRSTKKTRPKVDKRRGNFPDF